MKLVEKIFHLAVAAIAIPLGNIQGDSRKIRPHEMPFP
jgi:hypothetical protein